MYAEDVYKREENGKIVYNYYIFKLLHTVIYIINYSLIVHYLYNYL